MRSFRRRVARFLFGMLAFAGLVLILFYRGPGFGLVSLQSLLESARSGGAPPAPDAAILATEPAGGTGPIGRATEVDLRDAGVRGPLRLRLEAIDIAGAPTASTVDGNALRLRASVANETGAAFDGTVALRLPPAELERQADCRVRVDAGEAGACELVAATDGWAWQAGERVAEQIIEATLIGRLGGQPAREQAAISVDVRPRPVVLVHGFISDAGTWSDWTGASGFLAEAGLEGFAVGDGQFGVGPMDTGSSAEPRRGGNTIDENARILARYVEALRSAHGAARVDLVAHSMGGLIARRYVADEMPVIEDATGEAQPVVAQLHLIGTPNGGSHCAVPLAAMGMLLPMSAELTPGHVREVFNPSANDSHGVPFFVWAGDPVRDYAALVCTPLPTDAFVSVGSVAGALPDTVPFVFERIAQRHLAQTKAPEVFDGVLAQLARAPRDFPIAMPSGRPDLGGVRLAAEEELQVVLAAAPGDGTSAAGGRSVQLGIGPATRASFAVFGPDQPMGEAPSAAEPLSAAPGVEGGALPAGEGAGADGNVGSGDDEGPGADDGGGAEPGDVGLPSGTAVGAGAAPVLAGRYEVGLPSGSAWGAAAFVESGLRLRVSLPEAQVAPGETLLVRAELEEAASLSSVVVRVRLRASDGSIAAEWLLEDEGGFAAIFGSSASYTGQGPAPDQAGVYALVVEAEGQADAGEPVSRIIARAVVVE